MPLHDLPQYLDETFVFADRQEALQALVGMLESWRGSGARVLAVTMGGVAVGDAIATALDLPLDLLLVRKVAVPWNPAASYGAVAVDGTVQLHDGLIKDLGLFEPDISKGARLARADVLEQQRTLRGDPGMPEVAGAPVILADDAVVSAMTMGTAVDAVQALTPTAVAVAVPTGYRFALERLAARVDEVYCPNVRGGWGFVTEDAYRSWSPVAENEARQLLARYRMAS